MSDSETGTGSSDQELVTEFRCRKCPDRVFQAAEKDSHRQFHRQEKEKNKKRAGPRSRTRRRSPSPAITLFEPIPGTSTGRQGRRRPAASPAGNNAKRQSRKNYDDSIIGNWSNGTGA